MGKTFPLKRFSPRKTLFCSRSRGVDLRHEHTAEVCHEIHSDLNVRSGEAAEEGVGFVGEVALVVDLAEGFGDVVPVHLAAVVVGDRVVVGTVGVVVDVESTETFLAENADRVVRFFADETAVTEVEADGVGVRCGEVVVVFAEITRERADVRQDVAAAVVVAPHIFERDLRAVFACHALQTAVEFKVERFLFVARLDVRDRVDDDRLRAENARNADGVCKTCRHFRVVRFVAVSPARERRVRLIEPKPDRLRLAAQFLRERLNVAVVQKMVVARHAEHGVVQRVVARLCENLQPFVNAALRKYIVSLCRE